MRTLALRSSAALAAVLVVALPACSKRDELVPYGAATQGAEKLPPRLKTSGPVQVKMVEGPSGSAGGAGSPVSCAGKPEKVLSAGARASGTFGGVQVGDGTRVLLRQNGKVEYYRLADETLAYFFLAHKARHPAFAVTYDALELCLPEAGGYVPSSRMTGAETGGQTHEAWWRGLEPAAREAAKAAFQRYVDDAFAK